MALLLNSSPKAALAKVPGLATWPGDSPGLTGLVLLAAAILMGFGTRFGFSGQITQVWVILAVILATGRGWRSAIDGSYRGFQEFRAPAIAGIICTTLTALALVFFAFQGYRVGMYITVMAVGIIVNCIWLAIVFYKKFVSGEAAARLDTDWQTSQFFRYSLPLAMRGIFGFLFLKINIWMLGWLATDADAGYFRLTDQFLTIPALVLSATLAAVAPRISAAQLQGGSALSILLARVYGLMLALTLPLALFFWFNGPLIIRLFPDYVPASHMLMMFAPAMAVQGLGYAASILLVQGGKPGAAFGLTLAGGIANVAAAYVGFKFGGVMGLTLATAIVHFATHSATIIVTHSLFKMPFRVRVH